jgi:hypothetical protein
VDQGIKIITPLVGYSINTTRRYNSTAQIIIRKRLLDGFPFPATPDIVNYNQVPVQVERDNIVNYNQLVLPVDAAYKYLAYSIGQCL